jgi:quercetin dioxygenase-like cupin family protein
MANVNTAQWSIAPGAHPGADGTQAVPGTGASLKQVRITAGHRAPRHSHPHEQFVMVLAGGGELECEVGQVELRPGTVIRFAPDAWHSAVFTADTVLLEVNLPATPAQMGA